MSLTYPSILGAIIYFFFDATIQVTLIPYLGAISNSPISSQTSGVVQYHFFESLGLNTIVGFVTFIFITLFVGIHHSADYLYSKYSESQYGFNNFVWDTIISLLLAIAYIIISRGALQSLNYIEFAFAIFWFSFMFTYLVFLWWDLSAYYELRGTNKQYANFYKEMVVWFEVLGIGSFALLAVLAFFINEVGWFSFVYVALSVVCLVIFTLWFSNKVRFLEKLSRKINGDFLMNNKIPPQKNLPNVLVSVSNMSVTDIAECAKIFSTVYQDIYSEPWTIESAKARIAELFEANPDYCFTLRINGIVAGFLLARKFIWFNGFRIWLEEIVIKKQYRNKGFGKLLIKTLFDKCKNENVSGISLISRRDSTAYKIYNKLDFTPSNWVHLEKNLYDLEL